jgi:chromosome segregation ATPase
MPSTGGEDPDSPEQAYEQRTTQLYEARAALAEAVAALESELKRRHEELDGLRGELAGARDHAENLAAEADKQRTHAERLTTEIHQLREAVARLEGELRDAQDLIGTLQAMKAVRWTAGPRSLAYRIRKRGR